ncbi:MAG: hypothetical protein DI537_10405 [Stutzerimonas stutzeri]|nr:MAG: hypothetical protein DI537_10405 [Stutzerimonas stutzeri]
MWLIASSLVAQPTLGASTRENLQLLAQLWDFTTFATECRLMADDKSLLCSSGPITQIPGIVVAREWASLSGKYMKGEATNACVAVGGEFLNRGTVQEALVLGALDNNAFEVLICLFTNPSVKPGLKAAPSLPNVRVRTDVVATPLIDRLRIQNKGDDDTFQDCSALGMMLECTLGEKLRSRDSAFTRTTRYRAYDWDAISGRGAPIDNQMAGTLCASLNQGATALNSSFEKGEDGRQSLLICYID